MALHSAYTDRELLALLRSGDAEAFSEIYERYWDRLLAYAMRGVRTQDDAEDIVQELFTAIWRRRSELNIEMTLSTYLFNSIRFMALRHIEQHINRAGHLQIIADRLDIDLGDDLTGIEQEIFGRELEGQIEKLVQQLPEKMREVFLLSRRQHLSNKEIAQRLSISEETVKKQIYKSLQILRSNLGSLPAALLLCITTYYI